MFLGFHFGSAGKESVCNAGDLGSIPGLGRSPEEGKGYPLQYYILFQVAVHRYMQLPTLIKLNILLCIKYLPLLATLLTTSEGAFPGCSVVKNPPANAGDAGLSPDLERSHMLHSN